MGLNHLGGLLTASQDAVRTAANGHSLQPRLAGAQADLDAAAETVRDAEDLFESGGNTDWPGFHIVNLSPDVSSYRIHHVALHHNPLDVNVVVTQSAQQSGLYLSFGGASLDLAAANSSFTIEIGGRFGSQRLTFASGTTLSDMALAINFYRRSTGVSADVIASGATHSTGIKLEGLGFGNESFASVRVINDGGISTNHLGLYRLAGSDFNAVNTARVSDFHSGAASDGYTDVGQDIRGTINGHAAIGHGRTLIAHSPQLAARITLNAGRAVGTANAQTLGAMTAFRIEP